MSMQKYVKMLNRTEDWKCTTELKLREWLTLDIFRCDIFLPQNINETHPIFIHYSSERFCSSAFRLFLTWLAGLLKLHLDNWSCHYIALIETFRQVQLNFNCYSFSNSLFEPAWIARRIAIHLMWGQFDM